MGKLSYSLIISLFFFTGNLQAQNVQASPDGFLTDGQEAEVKKDTFSVCKERKWEISVGFGSWLFMESAKTDSPQEPFFLPQDMHNWQFSVGRRFGKKYMLDLNVGLQIKKDIPVAPGLLAILGGSDIQIEGSGGGFVPVKLGMAYSPLKKRVLPFVGAEAGMVFARSKYTEVKGNIFEGITKRDFDYKEKVPVFSLTAGCGYQTGEWLILRLKADYTVSSKFDDPIGGYTSYKGFAILGQVSVVF